MHLPESTNRFVQRASTGALRLCGILFLSVAAGACSTTPFEPPPLSPRSTVAWSTLDTVATAGRFGDDADDFRDMMLLTTPPSTKLFSKSMFDS